SVPVVCTSGASGPMAPPDEMQSHEIGISDRSMRTPVAEPDTWMLSTISSTSPGEPTKRVTTPANSPTPPRIRNPTAPLHSVGQSTFWSRWMTSRYSAPTMPQTTPTTTTRPMTRGSVPTNAPSSQRETLTLRTNTYRSTIYLPMTSDQLTDRDYRRLLAFR